MPFFPGMIPQRAKGDLSQGQEPDGHDTANEQSKETCETIPEAPDDDLPRMTHTPDKLEE